MALVIGNTTVNLGSDDLNQAFYNEVYDSNAAEYIVALQLNDTSMFRGNPDEIRLGSVLASNATAQNGIQATAANIKNSGDLTATAYYQAVVGTSDLPPCRRG